MASYKSKTFPPRAHKVQVRFNNEHSSESKDDAWRLIVEGVEYVVGSVLIESPMKTELFMKDDVLKGNIITYGHPEIDDLGSAIVRKVE